ncbi:YEATS domain-containing protein 2 [Nymphon striatum]|nr:YEATS domain-containing protein 2 [Nymphon striatum]
MTPKTLDSLMRIVIDGPDIDTFDPSRSVQFCIMATNEEQDGVIDPDYYFETRESTSKVQENHENDKQVAIHKIKRIIGNEFDAEILNKENELSNIENKIKFVELYLDRIRTCAAISYYSAANKNSNTNSPDVLTQIHPSIKGLLEDISEYQTNEMKPKLGPINKNQIEDTSLEEFGCKMTNLDASESKLSQINENPEKNLETFEDKKTSSDSDNYYSRLKRKYYVIVGNVSEYILPQYREEKDNCRYKWMIYVRTPADHSPIEKTVSKVLFYLHPSYEPNRIIEIRLPSYTMFAVLNFSKPPFQLKKRGWGEFSVKIELFFHDTRNKSILIIHKLKLDNTFTGLQTLGAETTAEFFVYIPNTSRSADKAIALVELSNKRRREESLENTSTEELGEFFPKKVKNEKSDDYNADDLHSTKNNSGENPTYSKEIEIDLTNDITTENPIRHKEIESNWNKAIKVETLTPTVTVPNINNNFVTITNSPLVKSEANKIPKLYMYQNRGNTYLTTDISSLKDSKSASISPLNFLNPCSLQKNVKIKNEPLMSTNSGIDGTSGTAKIVNSTDDCHSTKNISGENPTSSKEIETHLIKDITTEDPICSKEIETNLNKTIKVETPTPPVTTSNINNNFNIKTPPSLVKSEENKTPKLFLCRNGETTYLTTDISSLKDSKSASISPLNCLNSCLLQKNVKMKNGPLMSTNSGIDGTSGTAKIVNSTDDFHSTKHISGENPTSSKEIETNLNKTIKVETPTPPVTMPNINNNFNIKTSPLVKSEENKTPKLFLCRNGETTYLTTDISSLKDSKSAFISPVNCLNPCLLQKNGKMKNGPLMSINSGIDGTSGTAQIVNSTSVIEKRDDTADGFYSIKNTSGEYPTCSKEIETNLKTIKVETPTPPVKMPNNNFVTMKKSPLVKSEENKTPKLFLCRNGETTYLTTDISSLNDSKSASISPLNCLNSLQNNMTIKNEPLMSTDSGIDVPSGTTKIVNSASIFHLLGASNSNSNAKTPKVNSSIPTSMSILNLTDNVRTNNMIPVNNDKISKSVLISNQKTSSVVSNVNSNCYNKVYILPPTGNGQFLNNGSQVQILYKSILKPPASHSSTNGTKFNIIGQNKPVTVMHYPKQLQKINEDTCARSCNADLESDNECNSELSDYDDDDTYDDERDI